MDNERADGHDAKVADDGDGDHPRRPNPCDPAADAVSPLLGPASQRTASIGQIPAEPGATTKTSPSWLSPAGTNEEDSEFDRALDEVNRRIFERLPDAPVPSVQPSAYGERIRVYELIGEGGVGHVYRGYDAELAREVAIKELRVDLDEAVRRSWALREAEFTSFLEHPSVVPIYNLMERQGEPPAFVMRLARGGDLRRAIREFHGQVEPLEDRPEGLERWTLTGLLARLLAVADAVAYAHRRKVMHLDLKPSNVLINPDSETLVADWGFARRVGEPGLVGGTSGYRPPEQSEGRPEPRSDVYALGAILAEILSGSRPAEPPQGRPAFTHPPDMAEPLPGDPAALASIASQAMSSAAADRYESASAFAEEIRRWLLGQPVLAHPEGTARKFQRWRARHPTAVAGFVAAVFVSAIALAVLWGQQRQANSIILAARNQAQSERTNAVANFRRTRQLARSFLFDFHEGIKNLPGSTAVRHHLLETVLGYLDALVSEPDADPALRVDLASAYLKFGDVLGYPYGPNLARPDEATQSYLKAVRILEAVTRESPSHFQARFNLATAWSSLGDILGQSEPEQARGEFRKALALLEGLDREGKSADVATALARVYDASGLSWLSQIARSKVESDRHAAAAEADFLRALVERRAASSIGGPRDPNRNLAVTLDHLGQAQSRLGRLDDALASYEESLGIAKRLVGEGTNDVQARTDVAVSHQRIGDLYRSKAEAVRKAGDAGRDRTFQDKALSHYLEAATVARRLITLDGADVRAKLLALDVLARVTNAYLDLDQLKEAEAAGREAHALAQDAAVVNNATRQAALFHVRAAYNLGLVLEKQATREDGGRRSERFAEADRRLAEADAALLQMKARNLTSPIHDSLRRDISVARARCQAGLARPHIGASP